MHTDKEQTASVLIEGEPTERILQAAFKVQNTLGCGFLERVYENSLMVELNRSGITSRQQVTFKLKYEGVIVGDYCADLIADGRVMIECKAVANLDSVHEAQIMNYLKATGIRVGLLLNFGKTKLQFKRLVC